MQPRDKYQTIADFLADQSFRAWIRAGMDHDQWEEWTVEHPERAKLVTEARLWLLAMRVPESSESSADTQTALKDTWQKINQAAQRNNTPVISLWNKSWWRFAAAILLFSLAAGWFYQRQNTAVSALTYTKLVEQHTDGLIEQVNNTKIPQLVMLSDGSSVLLLPQSRLSYPPVFDRNKREVYLTGEGFFEISKNPKQPFFVFASETVTRVVGTSFRIKAYASQPSVEVTVRTGKVNVRSNRMITQSDSSGVLLLPNQGVRFERQHLVFEPVTNVARPVHSDNILTKIEQVNFDFTDAPVLKILETIGQVYSVDIDFPQDRLKNCYLTTSLTDQPLPEKLKIICESLGNNTRYEMNGTHITIQTNGCN